MYVYTHIYACIHTHTYTHTQEAQPLRENNLCILKWSAGLGDGTEGGLYVPSLPNSSHHLD